METITTVGGIDIQDATDAAAELSESLLAANVLGRAGQPSIIAIDRYINDTSQQIDRDVIVKKIRVSLNKAGVAQTMTTLDSAGGIGGESNIATRAARERDNEARANAFLNDTAAPELPKPDYALTFKILDNRVRAGRTRQTTYTFQMSLTDVKTGLAVWEDEKQITKQGSKPAVGW
jgi:PBP1b-binding outer membrane lipoprotein LpoB